MARTRSDCRAPWRLPLIGKAPRQGRCRVFGRDEAGAEAERLRGKLAFRWGSEDMPYGLRELGIEDPHGCLLCFAKDIG